MTGGSVAALDAGFLLDSKVIFLTLQTLSRSITVQRYVTDKMRDVKLLVGDVSIIQHYPLIGIQQFYPS